MVDCLCPAPVSGFHFMLLGDRIGDARKEIVYERIWRELAADAVNAVLSSGDTIQGSNNALAEAEWREVAPRNQALCGGFRCIWRPAITIYGRIHRAVVPQVRWSEALH